MQSSAIGVGRTWMLATLRGQLGSRYVTTAIAPQRVRHSGGCRSSATQRGWSDPVFSGTRGEAARAVGDQRFHQFAVICS